MLAGRVRIALRSAALTLLLTGCLPAALLLQPFTARNPVPRVFFAGVSRILGLKISVRGGSIQGRAVLLASHASWLDIPALAAVSGTAFVAHSGLAANVWLRWLCRLNNTIFVAREDRRGVAGQIEQVRRAIEESGMLTIFPEGGTGVELRPFKSSLLSAFSPLPDEISLRPVWLDYGRHLDEVAWIDEETGKDSFFKIAARGRPVPLIVHLLPPLPAEALRDRKTMAAAARNAIADRMDAARRESDQRVAL